MTASPAPGGWMVLLVSCLWLVTHGYVSAGDVYEPPSPEPTVEETQILESINRFREDPHGELERILSHGDWAASVLSGVDVPTLKSELMALSPAPPLVFDLTALLAARRHASYMVQHGLGHGEDPGQAGFSGVDPKSRLTAAGVLNAGFCGENAFRDAQNALQSTAAFIVDFGPGPGGMQSGRGHRTNLINAAYRRIGAGAVAHEGSLSVIHDFLGGGGRSIGGVIFVDAAKDGHYAPGEGRGGIEITASDGTHARTWASGAFTLELKSGGAVSLRATYLGKSCEGSFPAGDDNQHWVWAIPASIEHDRIALLIANAKKKTPQTPPYFKAQVSLAMAISSISLDPDQLAQTRAIIAQVDTQLTLAKTAVMDAMALGPKAAKPVISEQGKPFLHTEAASWFSEAGTVLEIDAAALAFQDQVTSGAKPTRSMQQELLADMAQARDACHDSQWVARIGAAMARVTGAISY